MNERQKLNKIIHNYVEVNKNEDYTNYKGLITALIEWKNEQLTLTDVVVPKGKFCKWEDHNKGVKNYGECLVCYGRKEQ